MDNCCCGRPIAPWAPPKAMRGKCECGRGSANADGAGAEGYAGDGCSQGRLSAPWPRFHGVDRADVYIIIRVCASYCGESALNPPTSPPIPRRRLPLAPAQRHALPEHFRSPTQRRPASPSVPLRAQKNGTAQWMCDAECLGRPSLRSVIGVGEPRAVRRRCGALACRRGA